MQYTVTSDSRISSVVSTLLEVGRDRTARRLLAAAHSGPACAQSAGASSRFAQTNFDESDSGSDAAFISSYRACRRAHSSIGFTARKRACIAGRLFPRMRRASLGSMTANMHHFTLQLSAAHLLADHEFARSMEAAVAAYWAVSRRDLQAC